MNEFIKYTNGEYTLRKCTEELLNEAMPMRFFNKSWAYALIIISIVIGCILYLGLIIAYSNRDIIYSQNHYLILVIVFFVNGLLYLLTIWPCVTMDLVNDNNLVLAIIGSSYTVSHLFKTVQILVVAFFGYHRIITYFHFFTGRFILYKKHTVNLVSAFITFSIIFAWTRLNYIYFQSLCTQNDGIFNIIVFYSPELTLHHTIYLAFITAILIPMSVLHILSFFMEYYRTKTSTGLANLYTKRVIIVSDNMKDTTTLCLYFIVYVTTIPTLLIQKFMFDKRSALTKNGYYKIIHLPDIIYMILSTIPFYVIQTPVRSALKIQLYALLSKLKLKSLLPDPELDAKTDTTVSISSDIQPMTGASGTAAPPPPKRLSMKESAISLNADDTELKFKIRNLDHHRESVATENMFKINHRDGHDVSPPKTENPAETTKSDKKSISDKRKNSKET